MWPLSYVYRAAVYSCLVFTLSWLVTHEGIVTGIWKIKCRVAAFDLLHNIVTQNYLAPHIVIWLRTSNIEIDCAVSREFMTKWWVEIEATG